MRDKATLTAISIACFDWYIHAHITVPYVHLTIFENFSYQCFITILCHRHTFVENCLGEILLVDYVFISENNKFGWIR